FVVDRLALMFPNWFQLRRRRREVSPGSPKWPRHFSCSSFKDIQNLLHDDDLSPEPYSPRSQVIHQPRSPARIHGCISNASFSPPRLFSVVDIPNTDHRGVVLYYTSLRIIRKTFEECRYVRSILHALRITIDERDLSMDSTFHDELQTLLGTKNVALPTVFIGGRYIGGTKEIKKLHEKDELRKLIGALPRSGETFSEICDFCSGWRFVICDMCNGSHKIHSERSGFVSCTSCNVQGLIRCVSCFPVHRRQNSKSSGR
ncbi:hypothetical protein CARUB_v10025230mg, partial [Capsella rubella]